MIPTLLSTLAVCPPCILIADSETEHEPRLLNDPVRFGCVIGVLIAVDFGLWIFNRQRAKSAVLYFEELPEEVITTLGLTKHAQITEATGVR